MKRIGSRWQFGLALVLTVATGSAQTVVPAERLPEGALPTAVLSPSGTVTLNVERVEIAALLKLLALASKTNIVAGPAVQGLVSVNLYDVGLDQALESVLSVAGFTHFTRGDIIYVVSEAERKKMPPDARDTQIRSIRVNHVNPKDAMAMVENFIGPYGKVVLNEAGKTLIIEETSAQIGQLADLIEPMDTPPLQVLISVKFLKVDYDDQTDLGVQFQYLTDSDSPFTHLFSQGFSPDPLALPETASGLFWGKIFADKTRVFLDALAETANTKLMAAPEILTMDGEEASILVGDKLGYRLTAVTDTAALETVEFLDVGTQLVVTPSIATDGLIRMKVHPQVSSGKIDAQGLPSESTSEVETTMTVADGETIVIGGLLSTTRDKRRARVPIIGDIPVLGYFFGRTTWSTTTSELLILITPHIVPVRDAPGALKTEGNAYLRTQEALEQFQSEDAQPVDLEAE